MERNIWIHLSFSFLFFLHLKHQLLRAFDHICMEKARYKFLVITIITVNDRLSPAALISFHIQERRLFESSAYFNYG